MTRSRRIYVLDTNVLMHDPTALFKFEEHDVFLPMTVLEELDNNKKGLSEASRNARQVSRFINELIEANGADNIEKGLLLVRPQGLQLRASENIGTLLFQTTPAEAATFGKVMPDNQILAAILALRDTGASALPEDFWDKHEKDLRSWTERGHSLYEVKRTAEENWNPNQYLYLPGEEELELRVAQITDAHAVLQVVDDYSGAHQVWGISARNREQNFALNALMDPDIDFVTLLGTAGTGKTLLALAAGLAQTMDQQRYREIIMTRATVNVGEDIGFLPGTEEEKMTPWMGALTDNLEVLTQTPEGGAWGRAATNDLLASRIKIRSMNFMRGRTFLSRYVIIDEAQNLSPKQMKTLITRAGPGTKIVCLGNVEQIDTPYLTETTSGLTYAVDRFKQWPHSAHVTLRRGERSRLADFASEAL